MRVILIRNLSSINHFFIFVDFAWPIYDWFFLLLPFKFETALCKRFHYMISISWLGYRLTSRLAGHEWNCIAILLLLEAFFRSLNEDIRHISYIKTHFCNIFFWNLASRSFWCMRKLTQLRSDLEGNECMKQNAIKWKKRVSNTLNAN